MFLNNKFVFEFGSLDQGFWPDGIYTPPTEAALKNDIEQMKALGFNMVRKHIKVEPARWYYWTDKLGLMVWQDMPSSDSYLPKDAVRPPVEIDEFKSELQRMVEGHWNHPSIIMWVAFNEGQGQHDTEQLVDMLKKMDPSRLVDEASGGTRKGSGDLWDVHRYPEPGYPPAQATQALACGEYGGIGYKVANHTWTGKGGGYTDASTPEELTYLYGNYAGMVKDFRDNKGLSAVVYTQLTDVETELNGLLTYDRLPKADVAEVARATHFEASKTDYNALAATSEKDAQKWKYTMAKPEPEWNLQNFDDAAWPDGEAGFGKLGAGDGRTEWKTPDIWMRRHFNPGSMTTEEVERLIARDLHEGEEQVYLNGELAFIKRGRTDAYVYRLIRPKAKAALKPDADNVLAIHCLQPAGGRFVDVGLYERVQAQK